MWVLRNARLRGVSFSTNMALVTCNLDSNNLLLQGGDCIQKIGTIYKTYATGSSWMHA